MALPFFSASGQTQSVWQIGKFDESPFEFPRNKQDAVTFEAGKSNPEKDWPRRQDTGHPYSILFDLPSPRGTYKLKISALIEQPRIPALRLEINGHTGTFFQHPKVSYSRSDFTYAFDPHESQSTLNIDLPLSFLKRGQNKLTITCVDDPPTPAGEEEIGGITYDARTLEQDSSASSSALKTQVDVQPTIFYRNGPGGLNELVDASIRFARPWRAGTAELEVNGRSYRAALAGGEFGEARLSFEIPEWTGTISAKFLLPSESPHPFETQLAAERKWTIFVVPHTHLDVGYTDYQGKVAETQARVLTQAGNLIQEHPHFRFSMDGSWNLQQLLSTRSQAKQDEIIDLIRRGKFAMPAQNCNLLTAYASLETLYRSMYASKQIAARYGLPFEYANITDVPTYSGSYPSVLASSGIKYWVAGANNDRAPIFYFDHWNEKSPSLVGWTGREEGSLLVFAPLHASSDAIWPAAPDERYSRITAGLPASVFKPLLQAGRCATFRNAGRKYRSVSFHGDVCG
jgi:alpha-mannosidase